MVARKQKKQHQKSFLPRSFKKYAKAVTKLIKKQDLRMTAKQKTQRRIIFRKKHLNKDHSISNENLAQIINSNPCECPICLELPIRPVMLDCGHVCCLQCFQENSVYSQKCCLCRQQQLSMEVTPNAFVSNLVNNVILPNYSEQINYWCRQNNFQFWQRKRRIDINQLSIGDFVDVKDENYTWRVGLIKLFFYNKKNQFCMEIKTKINSQLKIINLPVNSRRLASIGFFTRCIYLKDRNEDITKNFMESIAVPQICSNFTYHEQEFIDEYEVHQEFERATQFTTDLPLQLFEYEMGKNSQQYLFL